VASMVPRVSAGVSVPMLYNLSANYNSHISYNQSQTMAFASPRLITTASVVSRNIPTSSIKGR
jgi:hypothetical protein